MVSHRITDWDDAYANGPNIPGGDRWPAAWVAPARTFRETLAREDRARLDLAYGPGARNHLDLFLPNGPPRGLVIFVHGGFWFRLDKSYWSHLAAGAVARGFAVAMPSYTLCPQARIAGITREIGAAVEHVAALVDGPLFLTGHSAGGHLVARMICTASPFRDTTRARVRHVLSISGVHDLRPLMRTTMNATLGIDAAEAQAESPALLMPMDGADVTCWVGASERSEFVRQTALLANIWTGLGARTRRVKEPDRHHFNVIDGLAASGHPMLDALLCDQKA